MPLTKEDVVQKIRAEATQEEMGLLLALAKDPNLWDGLEKSDIMVTLRAELELQRGLQGVPRPLPRDNSKAICDQLLQPPLNELPRVDVLEQLLLSPPSVKLPIHERVLQKFGDSPLADMFQPSAPTELSTCLSWTIDSNPPFPFATKPWTAHAVNSTFLVALFQLDKHSAKVSFKAQRDEANGDSLMTVKSETGASLRPDGVLRDNDGLRMIAKWEEKGAGHPLRDSVDDLGRKTAVWSSLYYGDVQYLLCFAAAGRLFQFQVILKSQPSTPIPIGPVLDMSNSMDRAQLVIAAVNFYGFLIAMKAALPQRVLPAGQDLTVAHCEGYKRTLFFRTDRLTVQKRIARWDKYAAVWGVNKDDLLGVYEATKDAPGLVHLARGCMRPSCTDQAYSVELAPVGLHDEDMRPGTELQTRQAVHGLLHGLDAIHQAGYVHRDLHWSNCACDVKKERWYLLDLELCGRAGQKPRFHLTAWDENTLVSGCYTPASDIYCLGRMLLEHAGLVESRQGQAFLKAITKTPREQGSNAHELLGHSWIRCSGVHCRAAGALPGEM